MSREQRYRAIILKKQQYGEGDEIITFFTRERGKLRGLAKSSKFAKSKLQYSLQPLFAVHVTLSGQTGLPKVIGVEAEEAFPHIRESLEAVKIAYYAIELLLKFTPDEQKNENLYDLFADFFSYLNEHVSDHRLLNFGLLKFKIAFLEDMGFALRQLESPSAEIFFSNSKGGFMPAGEGVDHMPVDPVTYEQFLKVRDALMPDLSLVSSGPLFLSQNTIELHEILSSFLKYQLERDIKSERYLEIE